METISVADYKTLIEMLRIELPIEEASIRQARRDTARRLNALVNAGDQDAIEEMAAMNNAADVLIGVLRREILVRTPAAPDHADFRTTNGAERSECVEGRFTVKLGETGRIKDNYAHLETLYTEHLEYALRDHVKGSPIPPQYIEDLPCLFMAQHISVSSNEMVVQISGAYHENSSRLIVVSPKYNYLEGSGRNNHNWEIFPDEVRYSNVRLDEFEVSSMAKSIPLRFRRTNGSAILFARLAFTPDYRDIIGTKLGFTYKSRWTRTLKAAMSWFRKRQAPKFAA